MLHKHSVKNKLTHNKNCKSSTPKIFLISSTGTHICNINIPLFISILRSVYRNTSYHKATEMWGRIIGN